jgi:hypothetical protein
VHLVRVHFRNGLKIDYTFGDVGKAKACADDCAAAKTSANSVPPKAAHCHIFDQAGHEAWIDGSQIMLVQLVDVGLEIQRETVLQVFAQQTRNQTLEQIGMPTDLPDAAGAFPTNGRAPYHDDPPAAPAAPPAPQIGRFAA